MNTLAKRMNPSCSSSKILKASLLVIIMISPMVVSNLGQQVAASATTACTDLTLNAKMANTPIGMSQQAAISLSQSSLQYQALTSDAAAVTFSGISQEWSFDRTSCTVALQGLAVNFQMRSHNGSRDTVVIDVNPNLSVVRKAVELPSASASINVGSGTAYSGYGICSSSSCGQTLLGVTSKFNEPTVSQPTGTYLGQTEPNCHLSNGICVAVFWGGLATCDYTGMPWSGCSGSVVQTGTMGLVKYNSTSSTTSISYVAWWEYFNSNNPGTINYCVYDNPSPSNGGDSMQVYAENQILVTGYSGSNYYTYTYDNTASWSCNSGAISTSSYSPVYAEYIVERPQNTTSCGSSCGANSQYTLPVFTDITFSSDQLYYTSWNGAYNDYNPGYGFGVQMLNSLSGTNYQNTVTDAMNPQTINGINYGSFVDGYDDSIGT